MKLQKGNMAIDFSAKTINKEMIQLSQYKGQKILLAFYRNVACPFCNLQVHNLMRKEPELKAKNVKMVFLFETPTNHILKSSFHSGLFPIDVIGDPQKEHYQTYGIEESKIKVIKSFLRRGFKSHYNMALEKAKENKINKLGKEIEGLKEGSKIIPADFLINPDFTIHTAYYGSAVNDHIPIDDILAFANS